MSITNNENENRVIVDASVVIDLFAGRDRARVEVAEKIFMCFKARSSRVKVFAPRLFLTEVSGGSSSVSPATPGKECYPKA